MIEPRLVRRSQLILSKTGWIRLMEFKAVNCFSYLEPLLLINYFTG